MLPAELPFSLLAPVPVVNRGRGIERRSIAATCDRWGHVCSQETVAAFRGPREPKRKSSNATSA